MDGTKRYRLYEAQLTPDEHEEYGEDFLIIRVGRNVPKADGDKTRKTKVQGRAVPALKVQKHRNVQYHRGT